MIPILFTTLFCYLVIWSEHVLISWLLHIPSVSLLSNNILKTHTYRASCQYFVRNYVFRSAETCSVAINLKPNINIWIIMSHIEVTCSMSLALVAWVGSISAIKRMKRTVWLVHESNQYIDTHTYIHIYIYIHYRQKIWNIFCFSDFLHFCGWCRVFLYLKYFLPSRYYFWRS